MKTNYPLILLGLTLTLAVSSVSTNRASGQTSARRFKPAIPKVWDDGAIDTLELPLVSAAHSPRHIRSEYYYQFPVRPIFKSYPVYHPDREPSGYLDWLGRQEPTVVWDDQGHRPKLKSAADWIRAGELVFDAPIFYGDLTVPGVLNTNLYPRQRSWLDQVRPALARDGTIPSLRYYVRERGKIEVGILSCGMCHIRVLPDGSVIKGAQGNFPFDRAFAAGYRLDVAATNAARLIERALFFSPWAKPNPQDKIERMSVVEIAELHDAIPPGVLARHRSSSFWPVQVPDLIGVSGRAFLDRSGLVRHRGIGDLMRYAAMNQGGDDFGAFGEFIPNAVFLDSGRLPADPRQLPADLAGRYSDEQLYALALYVGSLKAPPNPNRPKTREQKRLVSRGASLFQEEGCAKCHDPKQGYTNNKLIAAPGFEIPDDHPAKDDIVRNASGSARRIGTDPTLTLATRRGTGLYKVPSLLGVWYRGPFEHNGSCAKLEDWFDERRLRDDYVPTGWKGPPGTRTRAVKGHEFGLDLVEEDKKALITFLRTL